MHALPPCGLYRTTESLGEGIPAGRLVYFHNHGDPGAGVYLPSGWRNNEAQWHAHGTPIPRPEWASTLRPLPAEGLYRVQEAFVCCAQRCRTFEAELLVQLGYNGAGDGIVFVPEWTQSGLGIPLQGSTVDPVHFAKLVPLKVARAADAPMALH